MRRLVGAIGDGSNMTKPFKFREEWDHIFIQSRAVDRELTPGTKYLFCEYKYDVRKDNYHIPRRFNDGQSPSSL